MWREGRYFAPYTEWECYRNGFYETCKCGDEKKIEQSEYMLSLDKVFYEACIYVINEWPVTSRLHLTNGSINKRAWIGHASAYVRHGTCEDCTIKAWHRLDDLHQRNANKIADLAIEEFLQICVKENCQTQKRQLELMFMQQQSSG